MRVLREHVALVCALLILWLVIGGLAMKCVNRTGGHLVYGLDDAYIHMAMAKNFAEHGVWGVTRYAFSSASSSPLWTGLLSLIYLIFGPSEIAPLLMNVLFASLLVVLAYAIWRRLELPSGLLIPGMLAVVFCAPMPALAMCGQEHMMHAALTVAVVYLAAVFLEGDLGPKSAHVRKAGIGLLVLAPFLATSRYESLFLVFLICLLLMARDRPVQALLFAGFSAIPLAAYGWISKAHGASMLPNSVLVKGYMPNFMSVKGIIRTIAFVENRVVASPLMLTLLAVAALALYLQYTRNGRFWKKSTLMPALFIGAALLHITFADLGSFYRYEAYLVVLGILVIRASLGGFAVSMSGSRARNALLAITILFFALPLLDRAVWSLPMTSVATRNIYEQQYQLAVFVRDYYPGETLAVNDIGAINYYADIRCLDLGGLADNEVASALRHFTYTTDVVRGIAAAQGVKVALVNEEWLRNFGGPPPEWVRVGEWRIVRNVVCGSPVTAFYAVDPSEEAALTDHLREFAGQLPPDVQQSGSYVQ